MVGTIGNGNEHGVGTLGSVGILRTGDSKVRRPPQHVLDRFLRPFSGSGANHDLLAGHGESQRQPPALRPRSTNEPDHTYL